MEQYTKQPPNVLFFADGSSNILRPSAPSSKPSPSSSKPPSSRASTSRPIVIPFCPHSDVQTDCRICGSETIEQTGTYPNYSFLIGFY